MVAYINPSTSYVETFGTLVAPAGATSVSLLVHAHAFPSLYADNASVVSMGSGTALRFEDNKIFALTPTMEKDITAGYHMMGANLSGMTVAAGATMYGGPYLQGSMVPFVLEGRVQLCITRHSVVL